MNAGSYLCKQRHPLLSSHLMESCAVKMLQPRRTIPQSCETRIVQLSHTVTVLCRDDEPTDVTLIGVGKLHIHAGCKGYSSTALLQASSAITSNQTIRGGDLISRIHLQYLCCEELGVKLNLSRVPLDVTFKPTISHFHDLKYASKKVADLEQQIQEQEWRNHQMLKYGSYSVLVYVVFATALVYVFYKLYKCIRHFQG